jgi:hypothetical protein
MGQTGLYDLPVELAETRSSACNTSPFRPGGADMCKLRSLHHVVSAMLSVSQFEARSFTRFADTRQALHCKPPSYGRAAHGLLIVCRLECCSNHSPWRRSQLYANMDVLSDLPTLIAMRRNAGPPDPS